LSVPGWYPLPDDEKFDTLAIHNEYVRGDMEALKVALHQEEFPNSHRPLRFGEPLVYAIYHSPVMFIRQLLEIGADPKMRVNDGFRR
jgi:hypothetical protein